MAITNQPSMQQVYRTAEMAELEGRDKADEALRERAMVALVDCMMRGEAFPSGVNRFQQINFVELVGDSQHDVLSDVVLAAWADSAYEGKEAMRQLCRQYFRNSAWLVEMMEKLARDENE